MIYFKACPKCGGDLTDERDIYGKYLRCQQCGLHRDLETHNAQRPDQHFPPSSGPAARNKARGGVP